MNSTFMYHTKSTFEQHISVTEHVKEKYNVHSKRIDERQVIADSFCYAGSRGGATEAGGLAGAQLVRAVVDRAAEFYFQKGMPRDMRGHHWIVLQHGDGSVAGNRKEGHCHSDVSGRGGAGCHSEVPPGRYNAGPDPSRLSDPELGSYAEVWGRFASELLDTG